MIMTNLNLTLDELKLITNFRNIGSYQGMSKQELSYELSKPQPIIQALFEDIDESNENGKVTIDH